MRLQLSAKHALLQLWRGKRECEPALRRRMRGQPVTNPHRNRHEVRTLAHSMDDRIAASRNAQDHGLSGEIAQLEHVRFGQPPQLELVRGGLPDMRELEPELVTLGLRILIDKAEMPQGREMPMHPRLWFAEMI